MKGVKEKRNLCHAGYISFLLLFCHLTNDEQYMGRQILHYAPSLLHRGGEKRHDDDPLAATQ
jgi:hypothetical protein